MEVMNYFSQSVTHCLDINVLNVSSIRFDSIVVETKVELHALQ